jgi:hypothetical protein
VAARRAGKSRFAGALAVRSGIRRYKLAPGERATVAIAAADRDQARVLLGYAVAPFEEREELRSRVQKRSVLEPQSADLRGRRFIAPEVYHRGHADDAVACEWCRRPIKEGEARLRFFAIAYHLGCGDASVEALMPPRRQE